jgi:hypothetical protein
MEYTHEDTSPTQYTAYEESVETVTYRDGLTVTDGGLDLDSPTHNDVETYTADLLYTHTVQDVETTPKYHGNTVTEGEEKTDGNNDVHGESAESTHTSRY